jgi:hypothetical protein
MACCKIAMGSYPSVVVIPLIQKRAWDSLQAPAALIVAGDVVDLGCSSTDPDP